MSGDIQCYKMCIRDRLLAFNGKSDFHFKSASTSGFNFEIDDTKIHFMQGVPFSTIAKEFLDYELLNAGLTVACL